MATPQKKLTDAERAALAQKLDDDLDRFMDDLAKKNSAEARRKPFDFDEWCRDIDSHPAFMTELRPAAGGEYSESIQALQALKYDEDDEDATDLAERAKKEGNRYFEFRKYRNAVDCYTHGIAKRCPDPQLNSALYANRAAAQKRLGNLRSATRDCVFARKFDPANLKAVIRGTECLLELGYAQQAVDWAETSKHLFAFNSETKAAAGGPGPTDASKQIADLEAVLARAQAAVAAQERDERKQRAEERKDLAAKKQLLDALADRALNFKPKLDLGSPEHFEWSMLEVRLAQMHEHQCVQFNEDGKLAWPLMIQYPEVGQTDFLTDCAEDVMIGVLLERVLTPPIDWDPNNQFAMDKVSMFVSDEFDEFLTEVYPWTEIGQMLATPGYQIKQGLPVLMVYTTEKVNKSFKNIDGKKFTVA